MQVMIAGMQKDVPSAIYVAMKSGPCNAIHAAKTVMNTAMSIHPLNAGNMKDLHMYVMAVIIAGTARMTDISTMRKWPIKRLMRLVSKAARVYMSPTRRLIP